MHRNGKDGPPFAVACPDFPSTLSGSLSITPNVGQITGAMPVAPSCTARPPDGTVLPAGTVITVTIANLGQGLAGTITAQCSVIS